MISVTADQFQQLIDNQEAAELDLRRFLEKCPQEDAGFGD